MINVLKFGGTSVGSASNMMKVADIIRKENARITVLSAMSGTTDALVKIAALASTTDLAGVDQQLTMLREKYTTCIITDIVSNTGISAITSNNNGTYTR